MRGSDISTLPLPTWRSSKAADVAVMPRGHGAVALPLRGEIRERQTYRSPDPGAAVASFAGGYCNTRQLGVSQCHC
jgi:hypothetical protein